MQMTLLWVNVSTSQVRRPASLTPTTVFYVVDKVKYPGIKLIGIPQKGKPIETFLLRVGRSVLKLMFSVLYLS